MIARFASEGWWLVPIGLALGTAVAAAIWWYVK